VRTLRQKPRARVELSGFNLSLLTATIALYHNLLKCCQVLFKIFLPTPKLPQELKRNRSRGGVKRLNTSAGLLLGGFKHPLLANSCVVCTCCIFDLNYEHHNLQLLVLSSCYGISPSEFSWRGFFLEHSQGSFQ
jgi:hypothetical protein